MKKLVKLSIGSLEMYLPAEDCLRIAAALCFEARAGYIFRLDTGSESWEWVKLNSGKIISYGSIIKFTEMM